jgi:hypothetical protein
MVLYFVIYDLNFNDFCSHLVLTTRAIKNGFYNITEAYYTLMNEQKDIIKLSK